jgi:diguanylate cyclase (GGDEF)-like protein
VNQFPNHRRVLVIDDTEAIHSDIRKILMGNADETDLDDLESQLFGGGKARRTPHFSFEIDSAMQGEEGLLKVEAACKSGRPYCMAFVDMRMPPGWDGLQTIEAIWRVDPEIQIVICTAYSDFSWQQVIDRLGWTDRMLVIRKPFDSIEAAQAATALSEKWALSRQVQGKLSQLEAVVAERTAELERIAMHDRLTGLPNRAMLMDRLSAALSRARRDTAYKFAVMFLDLDRFKVINDSLGHARGDILLQTIAKRLSDSLRGHDAVARNGLPTAARLGGDEFIILLEPIRAIEDAIRVADRLHKVLNEPYILDGHEVQNSVSIGITTSDTSYQDAEALLRDADIAMYRAKASGKGQHVIFDQKMHDQAMLRLTAEADLRRAIERRELFLEYQPIVSLKSGELAGFESLVRWNHPQRGRVSPAEFIPLAEETGLVIPMGSWVLEESARQIAEFRTQFPQMNELWMAVNVSRKQLASEDLLPNISQLLRLHNLPASALHLEITESAIMDDPQTSLKVMDQLREMGIGLKLDDFGTGQSSLSCVHRYPISSVKIDRSFVMNMDDDANHRAVVKAIVAMTHALQMNLVAEGVETQKHASILRELQCDMAQGYFFARPLSADTAQQYIAVELKKRLAA